MNEARYTKDGLLIPTSWLKKLGGKIRIKRGRNVLIIESEQRESARKELSRLVKKVRQAGRALGAPTEAEVEEVVREARKARAGSR